MGFPNFSVFLGSVEGGEGRNTTKVRLKYLSVGRG